MADDPVDAFAQLLDPALVVVTAVDGDERDGCLVGFHAQVSIHPHRYVVWLSRANRTYRIAQRGTHLAVHAIGSDHRELAQLFGGTTGDDVDKLASVEWTPGPGGVPLLAALPTRFVGVVLTEVDLPDLDHVGFVLEPVAPDSATAAAAPVPAAPLRLHDAADIDPGHPA